MKIGAISASILALAGVTVVTQPIWAPIAKAYHKVRTPDAAARSAIRSDMRLSRLTYQDVCDAKPAVLPGHVSTTLGGIIIADKSECGPEFAVTEFKTNIADIRRTVFVTLSRDGHDRLVTMQRPVMGSLHSKPSASAAALR